MIRIARFAVVASTIAHCASVAMGQDFIDRANALYADIRPEMRSDLVILPVLGKMAEPPRGVETVEKAALQPASESPIWREALAWAQAQAQRDALVALARVTEETDYRFAMAFGLPYGVEALVGGSDAGIEIVSADMYVDLDVGGTPLLAGADFRYFEGIRRLMCLVQVEATRLASEDDPRGALELLARGLFFSRQIADRQFAEEMTLGVRLMLAHLNRIRDVVYRDLRGERHLADEQDFLVEFIDRIAETNRAGEPGYLGVERLRFPVGNAMAAEQLARHVLTDTGANESTFVRTMSSLTSGNHPLMLFSQTPRWESASEDFQLPLGAALRVVTRIQSDFESRWNLRDPHDAIMTQRFFIDTFQGPNGEGSGDPIVATMVPLRPLLGLWQQVRLEAIGTRHALALAGYEYAFNQIAPTASSIRPRWIVDIEPDPLNSEYLRSNPSLQYVVPGRQTPRETHTVNIVLEGESNFSKRFRGDEFLLFSVGGDSQSNVAVEVQNTPENVPGADYLIWPPILSLLRENLQANGQLR